MLRTFGRILILCLVILWPQASDAYDLAGQVHSFRLANGMRWLLVRRTQAPVFSGIVVVRVGSADEKDKKTGLAHVFEHMAFKGSTRIGTRDYAKERPLLDRIEKAAEEMAAEGRREKPDPACIQKLSGEIAELQKEADKFQSKNEVWEILLRNGAEGLNAYTSKDITAYHASMPVNRLELWLRITADMIFDPVFREFYTERNVIAEERRAGVENDPDGAMSETLLSTAFASGPYHWSTIGFEKDILGLTIADAREFHRRHYVPSNMVGVLVGDLAPSQARAMVERVFGAYPRAPEPASPKSGEARGGVEKSFGFNAQPSLAIAYHKPALPDPTEYTFDVITALLCEGRSSRLERRLIYEKRVAKDIFCSDSYPGSRLDNLFMVWVEPLKGKSPREILKETNAEFERLSVEPVGSEEMERVRKNVTSKLVFGLDRNEDLAHQLAFFESVYGDWRILADYPKRIAEVGPDDVMKVAKKYFKDDNRVVLERIRKK